MLNTDAFILILEQVSLYMKMKFSIKDFLVQCICNQGKMSRYRFVLFHFTTRGIFRNQSNIYYGSFLRKSSIVDAWMDSKYASDYRVNN